MTNGESSWVRRRSIHGGSEYVLGPMRIRGSKSSWTVTRHAAGNTDMRGAFVTTCHTLRAAKVSAQAARDGRA